MEGIFIKILNMSITAGWVILAVIAARFLLKRAPRKVTVLLWGLVALRLILPFSIESPTSLVPSAETISPSIEYAERPEIRSGISFVNEAVNPVIGEALAPTPESSVNPMQVVTFVGSCLWVLGMAVMLAAAFVGFLRLRRKTREAVRLRDNIWICDQVETPFVLGILRPRIYLPSGFVSLGIGRVQSGLHDKEGFHLPEPDCSSYADGFEAVLAHERAHVSRKDPLWKALGFLLLTVYWFHPLVWVAYILFCRDIETACDEKVIRDMDAAGRKAYAHALVNCGRQQKVMLVCPLAFGEVGLKERVKGVLNYKKPGFWIILGAFAVCIVVAVCFATNPASKPGSDPEKKVLKVKVESLIEVVTTIRVNGVGAIQWFADGTEETKIGWMYPYQLEEYFANADWKECEVPESLPDSERIRIPLREDFFLTIYKEPQLAFVQLSDQESCYQIGPKDYETLLELFHPYSRESMEAMEHDEVHIYTPYVGDASKVSQIARALPYPNGYTYNSIKIWSQTEPYGLDVYVNGTFDPNVETLPEAVTNALRSCAESAFASIGNLGAVRFIQLNKAGSPWNCLYSMSRQAEEIPQGHFTSEKEGGFFHLSFWKDEQGDRFLYACGTLSHFGLIGTAVRSGDRLICRTDDGDSQLTFTIKDENTLLVDAKNSVPVDEGATYLHAPMEEGDAYHWVDEETFRNLYRFEARVEESADTQAE